MRTLAAILALAAAVSAQDSSSWRGDVVRTANLPELAPPDASPAGLTLKWDTQIGSGNILATPVVAAGRFPAIPEPTGILKTGFEIHVF